jgi:hypothetical protein
MIVALLALFVALGGPAHAARLINGKDIKAGTVTSRQLEDRTIKPRDLAASTLRALSATPDGSITAAKLGENAVTTRALAPGSVLSGTIADGGVTAADLAPSSVGAEEVGDNAIGQSEILNNGVGATEIADQSIDGGKVVDGSLLARDLARFSGTLTVDFPRMLPGTCQGLPVPDTAADRANIDISGDLVVASPGANWPWRLTYGVTNASEPDQFAIYACNPTTLAVENPPPVTFRWVVIRFG